MKHVMRLISGWAMLTALAGCTTATPTKEAADQSDCRAYSRPFEHSKRMKDACMISRGYVVVYDTTAGWVQVSSKAEPKQPPETIATDLKGCNDASTGLGYNGRLQFKRCMEQRGYSVATRD